ncbi:MAG: class I SAM-dependent methyltransferase [Candidatus Falkowbacteria bacterium]
MYYFTKQYMEQTRRTILSCGKNIGGLTLYDIGIGRGRALQMFKHLGIQNVIGFEISMEEVKFAENQAARLNMNLTVVADSADNMELKKIANDSCRLVTMMNVLFCVNDKVKSTMIGQAKRILCAGGILIVLDMQRPSLLSFFSLLSGKPWRFFGEKEFLRLMEPLRPIAIAESNHFYFENRTMTFINKFLRFNICYALDAIARFFKIPGATKTFIFIKEN